MSDDDRAVPFKPDRITREMMPDQVMTDIDPVDLEKYQGYQSVPASAPDLKDEKDLIEWPDESVSPADLKGAEPDYGARRDAPEFSGKFVNRPWGEEPAHRYFQADKKGKNPGVFTEKE